MDAATRKKLLQAATTKLKKQFGDDIIIDTENPTAYEVIPTGSLLLDRDLGIGGIPLARITEISGFESSGKTTIATCLMINAQKKYPDKMVLMVDSEQAYDLNYAVQLGLDTSPDRFLLLQPDSAEECITVLETYGGTGLFSLMVYDSVGGSLTNAQISKGVDEATMGSLAKVMTVGINKLKTVCKDSNTALFLINQIYEKMSYGGGTQTKGGAGIRFSCSVRIQISKRDLLSGSGENKEDVIGQGLRWRIIKNKCASPYKTNETLLYFGKGFDQIYEVTDLAISYGIISRGGAWYNFEVPEKKGSKKMTPMKFQGKEAVIEFLKNDSNAFEYIKNLVIQNFNSTDFKPTTEEIEIAEED